MPSLHGRYPGQAYESIVVADRDDFEVIALAQYPSAPACPIGGKARSYTFTRANNGRTPNPHQTTKPLPLMLAMVDDFTVRGDIVLDPYCGSSSTGLACVQRGRLFLGIERSPLPEMPISDENPDFFGRAVRRMRGEEARPRPEQAGLFDPAPGGS
jgi:hypothetical protein